MTRRATANTLATLAALTVGAAAYAVSYKMREPQIWLDYAALIFAGLITSLIAFFITWGHFQKEPQSPNSRS